VTGPFAGRGARWLALLAAASLAASGLLAVFGDAFDVASSGADAYSRSALGHHALLELWRRLGGRALLSRHQTAARVGGGGLLALEPEVGQDRARAEKLSAMLAAAPRALLVLPKRAGSPDPLRPAFLDEQHVMPHQAAEEVLRAAGLTGAVVRPQASLGAWRGDLPTPALDAPQLVTSGELTPLLATDQGILVGARELEGRLLLVLSDPDVIAAHGLGKGDNALLATRLLEQVAGRDEPALVVDETLHGHEQEPSLARELLRWPLVLATLQAAFALGLAAWAAAVRFGRPAAAPRPLAPGRAGLVDTGRWWPRTWCGIGSGCWPGSGAWASPASTRRPGRSRPSS